MHMFRKHRTGFTSLTALSSSDQDLPALIEHVLRVLRVTLEPGVTVPAAQRIHTGGAFECFVAAVFREWREHVRRGVLPSSFGSPHYLANTQLSYLQLLDERDSDWVVADDGGGRLATTILLQERVAVITVRLHYTCDDVRDRYAPLPRVQYKGLTSFLPMHEMPRFLNALPAELREALYENFACSANWLVACDWMDEHGGKLIANITATMRRLFLQVHEMNQQERLTRKHNAEHIK